MSKTFIKNRAQKKNIAGASARGELPIVKYIYNPCFDDPDAIDTILGPFPNQEEYNKKCKDISVPKNMSPELVGAYLFPLLTREQEAYLFRKMNYYKHLVEEARSCHDMVEYYHYVGLAISVQNLLVSSNTRLVYNFVKKIGLTLNNYFEAAQDAMLTLINSVLKFDYSKGIRLSTYATNALINWKIRNRALSDRHIVTNIEEGLFVAVAGAKLNSEAEDNESLANRLVLVKSMLSKLDSRERKIVRLRMGLGPSSPRGRKQWTLVEIGLAVGVTKERVRQIHEGAIKKMRELKPHEARMVNSRHGCF